MTASSSGRPTIFEAYSFPLPLPAVRPERTDYFSAKIRMLLLTLFIKEGYRNIDT